MALPAHRGNPISFNQERIAKQKATEAAKVESTRKATQLNLAESGAQKLRTASSAPTTVQPLVKPNLKTPQAVAPVRQKASLEDFIKGAQRLSRQKTDAASQQLAQTTGDVADQVARSLHSQNIGATSGAGQELALRAIERQAGKLEPFAQAEAARLGERELDFRQQREIQEEGITRQKQEALFSQVLQGTVDVSQLSQDDLAAVGITDPAAIRTLSQVDLRNAMIADGLDPNRPEDIQSYRQGLKDAKGTEMRQQIIAGFSAAKNGQIPTPDEVEMMMYIFGQGTGVLSPEEETALIGKFNEEQWEASIKLAEAQNPPEGKVLCTELHRQGYLSDEVYNSDALMGDYYRINDPFVVYGYHLWAWPLVKLMRSSKVATMVLRPFITGWAHHMDAIVKGEDRKGNYLGKILHRVGVPVCRVIGKLRGELTCQSV